MLAMFRTLIKYFFFGGVFFGLLSLSYWQFQRGEEKKALLAAAEHNAQQPEWNINTTPLAQLPTPSFTKMTLTGHYHPAQQFLLDNQIVENKLGVRVITPFSFKDVTGQMQTVLVDRGFIADGGQRTPLPPFTTPTNSETLHGQTFIPSQNPFIRDSTLLEGKNSPWRIQSIRIAAVEAWLKTPLLPFVLTLSSGEPGGFVIVPKTVTVMTPARHIGYAFTWLGLALTWIVLIGLFYRHERRHEKSR